MPSFDSLSWYRRNYKDDSAWVDDTDPRCWRVIETIGTNLYNLLDNDLPGGGLQPLGRRSDPDVEPTRKTGLILYVRRGGLATVDFDELTRLTIAAHHYCVRVDVDSADLRTYLRNPFDFESGYAEILQRTEEEPWEPKNWAGCQATVKVGPKWRWARVYGNRAPRAGEAPGPAYPDLDYHMEHVPEGASHGFHSIPPTGPLTCATCHEPILPLISDETAACQRQLWRPDADSEWVHHSEDGADDTPDDHIPERTSIEVQPINGLLQLMFHPRIPRIPGVTSGMEHHPTLDHLVDRIHRVQGKRRTTRTQTLLAANR